MKKFFLVILCSLSVTGPVLARDFMVEFIAENYKETQADYSSAPVIYHSIQVKTDAGPKLLILTGQDLEYRRWLRQFIARGSTFIARVPDDENDAFISAKAFDIDVALIHPVNGRKWAPEKILASPGDGKEKAASAGGGLMLQGDKHILVIDKSGKRSRLITSVINGMGYTAMVSHNGPQALQTFRNQPEKFKMIIADYDTPGMPAGELIDNLLKVDHQIPILLGTGYNNPQAQKDYITRFSGAGTVTVTPVVLENLRKTINQLVRVKG